MLPTSCLVSSLGMGRSEGDWSPTTNDNLTALRFYQKRGFSLVGVYPNALEHSRRLKPEIPLVGMNGIPLRDELELEMLLDSPNSRFHTAFVWAAQSRRHYKNWHEQA